MASQSTSSADPPPVVALCQDDPRLLPYTLRWPLFPAPQSLSALLVLDDPTSPTSPAQPFQRPDGSLHPIAALPVTSPPVATLKVTLQTLEDAYDSFVDMHARSLDEEYTPRDGVDGAPCTCCGYAPLPRPEVTVTPPPGSSRSEVTLGDYVTQVHPFLLGLEDAILRAVAEPPHLFGNEKRGPGQGGFWARFPAPKSVWLFDEYKEGSVQAYFQQEAAAAARMVREARGKREALDDLGSESEEEIKPDPDIYIRYLQWCNNLTADTLGKPGHEPPPTPWEHVAALSRQAERKRLRAERRAARSRESG